MIAKAINFDKTVKSAIDNFRKFGHDSNCCFPNHVVTASACYRRFLDMDRNEKSL